MFPEYVEDCVTAWSTAPKKDAKQKLELAMC